MLTLTVNPACYIRASGMATWQKTNNSQVESMEVLVTHTQVTSPSPKKKLQVQKNIQSMLNVLAIKQYKRYLGVPSFICWTKYSSFAQIKEKVWSKLKWWKEKLISQAGKDILIKSVAQTIPTYAMSCFRLPNCLIKKIEVLIQRFWWEQGGEKGKMHWLPWGTLCK